MFWSLHILLDSFILTVRKRCGKRSFDDVIELEESGAFDLQSRMDRATGFDFDRGQTSHGNKVASLPFMGLWT